MIFKTCILKVSWCRTMASGRKHCRKIIVRVRTMHYCEKEKEINKKKSGCIERRNLTQLRNRQCSSSLFFQGDSGYDVETELKTNKRDKNI